MANTYFSFKQFTVQQHLSAMKVTTDACVFGAWVAAQLQKGKQGFVHALDIGTGTGLLSLMVAQQTALEIDAVEIEKGAAQQAAENFLESPWAQRLHLHEGDITQITLNKTYDCIFSNPPFYENELASPSKTRNLAHHSSSLTLEQLFRIIYQRLNTDGSFFLLLPFKRKEEIEQLLAQQQLYIHTMVEVLPTVTHAPFRVPLKGGKKRPFQKEKQQFSIKEANGQYTPAFIQLLQPYYLYL